MLGVLVSVATVLIYTCTIFATGPLLTRLFSADPDVLEGASAMWPAFSLFMLISGPFALLLGLNRGLGLQRQTAYGVVALLWPVGAPLVFFAAHDPSQVWLALTGTYSLLVCAMGACAVCSDWHALSRKAVEQSRTAAELHPGTDGGLAAADSARAVTAAAAEHAWEPTPAEMEAVGTLPARPEHTPPDASTSTTSTST